MHTLIKNVRNRNEMLIPINISASHFVAAKINITEYDKKITITLYDSLEPDFDASPNSFEKPLLTCINVLAAFIVYERSSNHRFNLDIDNITFDVKYQNVPQQLDGSSCGLFQGVFLIYLLSNQRVPECICLQQVLNDENLELQWCVDNRNNRTKYETFIAALRANFAAFYSDTTTERKELFNDQVGKFTCPGLTGGLTRNHQVVQMGQSFRPGKKFMVQIGSTTVHFGQKGAYDFTRRGKDAHNIARKKRYIERHAAHEDWTKRGLHSAGFWARWILWNKTSKRASIRDVEAKYNLHIVPFSIK